MTARWRNFLQYSLLLLRYSCGIRASRLTKQTYRASTLRLAQEQRTVVAALASGVKVSPGAPRIRDWFVERKKGDC